MLASFTVHMLSDVGFIANVMRKCFRDHFKMSVKYERVLGTKQFYLHYVLLLSGVK